MDLSTIFIVNFGVFLHFPENYFFPALSGRMCYNKAAGMTGRFPAAPAITKRPLRIG